MYGCVLLKTQTKPKLVLVRLTSEAVRWSLLFPYLQFTVASLLREGEKRYAAEGLAPPCGWFCTPRGADVLYERAMQNFPEKSLEQILAREEANWSVKTRTNFIK